MKIQDYKIVESYASVTELRENVMHYIQDGYVPIGGICTTFASGIYYYCQALIKYEQNEIEKDAYADEEW